MPCLECQNNTKKFFNIDKTYFNQYDQAKHHFDNDLSVMSAQHHAKQKLTYYLANALGTSSTLLTRKILATVRSCS